ncbi:MAG TPA: hypothetical protein VL021_10170 [Brumimicrobium sp.]|nr:hypothetical protein [Brumimicrobium sp.]
MKELRPLTISNSVKNAPTVLLTDEMKKYFFIQPIVPYFMLAYNVYTLLFKHFKVETLEAGFFTLKGTKYLCAEGHEGIVEFSEWSDYLWNQKSGFNNLLNPELLFRILLVNLYFPLFKTRIFLNLDKKDRFIVGAYPVLQKEKGIQFEENGASELDMTHPSIIKLLKYIKEDLAKYFEEFEVLVNDEIFIALKYQVSMYPEIRNQYWEEVKKCFEEDFRSENKRKVNELFLKLR